MTDSTKQYSTTFEIAAQLIAVFVAVLLSVFAIVGLFSGNKKIQSVNIESRINPNHAQLGSLVRLNNVGLGKASAIIAYRQNIKDNGSKVFSSPKDLEKVKGIGPKTVQENLSLLKFE